MGFLSSGHSRSSARSAFEVSGGRRVVQSGRWRRSSASKQGSCQTIVILCQAASLRAPGRKFAGAVGADGITRCLVGIEEHEALLWGNACAGEVFQALDGELDSGEGIAGASAEIMYVKVDVPARVPQPVLQQAGLGHLGFALTADENRSALRNRRRTAACHPMVGTPP